MPYFKNTDGSLHFLESAEFEHLLPAGCVQIADAEAAVMQKLLPDQAKAVKWDAIKAERARRAVLGVPVIVLGVTKWFHSDEKSRAQQLKLLRDADRVEATGGDMAAPLIPIPWSTMDNSNVTMTASLAQDIAAAATLQDGALYAAARVHKSAMENSPDPASYDFSADWPAIFESVTFAG